MGLKYYQLSPPAISASSVLVEEFEAVVNHQFEVASDVYVIKRESSFASGSLVDATVRLTSAIDNMTGARLSDDFKQLIFKPSDTYFAGIGTKYYFENNYWICVYSDTIKSLSNNCMVRRCNDYLRWIGDNGVYYEEVCAIDYKIARSKDTLTAENLIIPQGYVDIFAQLNAKTELIKGGQRFLFGRPNNRLCWRVFGNGVQNTQNQETEDDTTSRLLTLTVGGWEINNDVDNLTLGIADYYNNVYALSLTPAVITGNVGETRQLVSTVTLNGNPVTASVVYTSSDAAKVGVSTTGSLTLSASGVAVITSTMASNSTVSDSATVTVSTSGIVSEEVRITPSDDTFILEDESETFTAYVYTNGIQQSNVFTYPLADANVPAANYTMTAIGNNTFTINNVNKYLDYPLLINATSGSFVKQISINLKGAW